MSNASTIWSLEDFEQMGSSVIKTRLWQFAGTIAALLFTTTEFYSWYNSPSKSGGGRQLINCIIPTQKTIAKNHLRLILEIEQGYQDCPEFFFVAKGGLTLPPVAFGLNPATIEMRKIERGAVYDIHYTEALGALVWLRKIITWPFNARIAGNELKETNELLIDRYFQLEQAKEQVQKQAAELESVYKAREIMQQEFSRKQIESQEAERKRLASELHDGLGQNLLVVKNELQQFLSEQQGPQDDLRRVTSLVQESVDSVREIASNLHPHHIERLGFCAAIEAMTENISHSAGLRIECSCDKLDHQLPKEIEIHLYRIIQEGLSNIVRHAFAHNARVEVRKNPKSMDVIITDDGCGFDIREFREDKIPGQSSDLRCGFGLASMLERARIIGGTLTIESSASSGTTIHLTLPQS
jgi:signal transduction histidine kinase